MSSWKDTDGQDDFTVVITGAVFLVYPPPVQVSRLLICSESAAGNFQVGLAFLMTGERRDNAHGHRVI